MMVRQNITVLGKDYAGAHGYPLSGEALHRHHRRVQPAVYLLGRQRISLGPGHGKPRPLVHRPAGDGDLRASLIDLLPRPRLVPVNQVHGLSRRRQAHQHRRADQKLIKARPPSPEDAAPPRPGSGRRLPHPGGDGAAVNLHHLPGVRLPVGRHDLPGVPLPAAGEGSAVGLHDFAGQMPGLFTFSHVSSFRGQREGEGGHAAFAGDVDPLLVLF